MGGQMENITKNIIKKKTKNNMVKETTTNGIGEDFSITIPHPGNDNSNFDTLYEAYMKLSKEDLARILAARDTQQQTNVPQVPYVPAYPTYPTYPTYPSFPWITWCTTTC